MKAVIAWLVRYWVQAALTMGVVFTLLTPLIYATWSLPLFAIFIQLPTYLLHQVEEHTDDRFRIFVNRKVFGAVEALTPASIVWINLPGVWGVNIACLYAAHFAGIGWGLTGIYLTLVNAVVHVLAGIAQRAYNPGLWTGVILFLPVGGWAWMVLNAEPGVTRIHHLVGLTLAVLIHVAIVAYAKTRSLRLARS
ncbi:MAG TPA: HXXEE domain-containing protein [Bryobacteraceae bacterium]|jgi:hypothetical protein